MSTFNYNDQITPSTEQKNIFPFAQNGVVSGELSDLEDTSVNRPHILIVEDEEDISDLLKIQFEAMGAKVTVLNNGKMALDQIQGQEKTFDLYVLDRMLPEVSGLEICRFLRMYNPTKHHPILMVTALTKPQQIVEGLNSGADDYITKPFDMEILLARVKALLRRWRGRSVTKEEGPTKTLEIKGIRIDVDQYKVWKDGHELDLTLSEYKLLTTFLKDPGKVHTRNQLVEAIQDGPIAVTERTIDTHIFGLRKKLKEYSNVIETIRGIGYRVINEI
jgi:two-component system phosphate regulon response regulator PhoB